MNHQQVEIEFKNLLTKKEYNHLLSHFKIKKSDFVSQKNFYFDTKSFSLKERRCALRIRYKNGSYELTLKEPLQIGLLETNQSLTDREADLLFNNLAFPDGDVKKRIELLQLAPNEIVYFGSLKTIRAECVYKDGTLVFDRNYYLKKEDYELEYEVTDYDQGKKHFQQLLQTFSIPHRKTINKVARFYLEKLKMVEVKDEYRSNKSNDGNSSSSPI